MALGGSRLYCSPCRNFPPIDPIEDKLVKDPGPIEGLYLGTISPTLSHNSTLGPDLALALIPALIPTPASAPVPINELFKQFMKAYLELN